MSEETSPAPTAAPTDASAPGVLLIANGIFFGGLFVWFLLGGIVNPADNLPAGATLKEGAELLFQVRRVLPLVFSLVALGWGFHLLRKRG